MSGPRESWPTAERLRALFNYDPATGALTWRVQQGRARAGDPAGHRRKDGRNTVRVDRLIFLGYRVIWCHVTGEWPRAEIDHIDCNPSNDAWSNLREASGFQNGLNRRVRADSKAGIKGVQWCRQHAKWRARFRRRVLGYFGTLDEANAAYFVAASAADAAFARAQ